MDYEASLSSTLSNTLTRYHLISNYTMLTTTANNINLNWIFIISMLGFIMAYRWSTNPYNCRNVFHIHTYVYRGVCIYLFMQIWKCTSRNLLILHSTKRWIVRLTALRKVTPNSHTHSVIEAHSYSPIDAHTLLPPTTSVQFHIIEHLEHLSPSTATLALFYILWTQLRWLGVGGRLVDKLWRGFKIYIK